VGKGVVVIFVTVCLWGTTKIVKLWEQSTDVYWRSIEAFHEPKKQKVFLLNVPDNYQGIFMFRNFGGEASFDEVWRWIGGSDYSGKMYEVFQYNMTSPDDDFIVTWESQNKLKVEFAQWGSWWWRHGIGGGKYSNEEYTAWPEGKYYFVEFNKSTELAQILFYTPDGWKEIVWQADDLLE
jgi:hypothetical protein